MVFKRGKFYQYRFILDGKVHQKSTHQTNRDVAKTLEGAERTRLVSIKAGIATPLNSIATAKAISIGDLLDNLKEHYVRHGQGSPQNLSLIEQTRKDFGKFDARTLSVEQVDAVKDKLRLGGYTVATINRRLQCVIRCYRNSGIKYPHITQFDESDNVRQGFFSETELAAVLANLPPHLADFVEWCSVTGQRRGEVAKLAWSMIEGDELHIPGTICKNGKARKLSIIPELVKILERRRAVRTITMNGITMICPLIFHRGNGRFVPQFQTRWAKATEAAGCPGKLLHDLRRFAVRNLVNAGVPIPVAKKWSGHRSNAMFDRYVIPTTDDLRRAGDQVREYRAQEKGKAAVAIR